MDYLQIYSDIINKALSENRKKKQGIYYEKHHILPRSLDGEDENDNLVLLTAKEHFVCHKLLVEIFPKENSMICAFWMMCNKASSNKKRNYIVSAREYERVRVKFIKTISGENHPFFGRVGDKHPSFGKTASKETIEKMIKTRTGKIHEKITCIWCGKIGGKNVMPQYHFDNCLENPKNKDKNRKKKILTCPYCEKSGGNTNMRRYHFDNCKFNPKNNKEEIEKQRRESNPRFGKGGNRVTCLYCSKSGGESGMKIHHFENCSENPKNNKEEILKRRQGFGIKMGKLLKGRRFKQKQIICPYCDKIGGSAGMTRYHFDNCKQKEN